LTSNTPLYVPSLMLETKFCTHTEPQVYSNVHVLDRRQKDKRFWTEW
jgi:hypothetical protein